MKLFILVFIFLSGCSLLTTPLRDCKSMCSGKAQSYESTSDSEKCECPQKWSE